jgi:hypothetical protein
MDTRLTILYKDPDNSNKSFYQCFCGNIKSIDRRYVNSGNTRSCGCLRREATAKFNSETKVMDLSGKRFGALLVTETRESRDGVTYWLCECDCGNEKYIAMGSLRKKDGTRSCGCSHFTKGPTHHNYVHGLTNNRLYKRLSRMIERCYNPKADNYKDYGARGIKVHQPWIDDRSLFVKYMESEYPNVYDLLKQKYEIDRIDVNGNYEPGNIRLVPCVINANNKRNTRYITAFGETDTLSNLARKYGIDYGLVKSRVVRGWHPEKALREPKTQFATLENFDKPYTNDELVKFKL